MSDAVSVLNGASAEGYARVEEAGLRGMITLRGDLSSAAVKKAVKAAVGQGVPGKLGSEGGAGAGVLWFSPDELLLMCAYDEAGAKTATLSEALSGQHHLAVNVSDARAVFRVTGVDAREALAKLTPADLRGLTPGVCRRTRLAQVPAALWIPEEDVVEILCFRSVGQYMFNLLKTATLPGSEVGYL